MQASPCPACGRPSLVPWRPATASDPQLAGRAGFSLDRCAECGSAATLGDAPDRAAMYEGGTYAPARGTAARLLGPLRRLAERDRTRFTADLPRGSRVLEVGAGDGKLVAAMRAAGLDARGIDPSPAACAAAAALGVEVANAGVDEAEVEPASPRTPSCSGTRSSTSTIPPARWRGSARWTRPAGAIVVAVPNLASWQARDRRRSLVSSGRAAPPHPLHPGGDHGAARAQRLPGRAHPPPAGRAESPRDVADPAQPAHRASATSPFGR